MQVIFDEIVDDIQKLNIKDNLKEELYYFNKKLKEILITDNINKFDVIIDNMSRENIDILLEYTTNIIEKYGLYTDFIKYRNDFKDLEPIKNSVIIIDEFDIFKDKILNAWNPQEKFDSFFTNAKINNNMIIISCTNMLECNLKKINSKIFNSNLCIHLSNRETSKDLYKKLINKYNEKNINCTLSYNYFKEIINSLNDNYYVRHFDIIEYIYDYSIKKMLLNNKKTINNKIFSEIINKPPDLKNKRNNENINDLIGLKNVKNELINLYNYLDFTKKMKINDDIYLNMFFLGNPGTGKTTVARMYVNKLYELGYIKENKLVEITPNDLMGRYVGQTKDTIRGILERANGGVLFIDEAYLISEDIKSNISYMKEALIELLKYLENPKNIVIFSGYKEKMKELYNENPGIKSRIYKEIIFEDYTNDELYNILEIELKNKGLKLKNKNQIIKYIDKLKLDNNFGNARTIKQLSQKMIMNHANKQLKEDNLTIDYSDLPKLENVNILKMGFGMYD